MRGPEFGIEGAEVGTGWVAGRTPRVFRKSSIRLLNDSELIPAGAGRWGPWSKAGAGTSDAGLAEAVFAYEAAGRTSYASRLMFNRCRGVMLSDVMLPP
jgi:hypothetical protein